MLDPYLGVGWRCIEETDLSGKNNAFIRWVGSHCISYALTSIYSFAAATTIWSCACMIFSPLDL